MKEKLFSVTIKDCEVQTFCTGGPGGQHKNAKQNGVRIIHPPSGVRVEHRDGRDQAKNKVEAWVKLANHPKFRLWLKMRVGELMGQPSAEEVVDRMLKEDPIRVEVRTEKGWELQQN